MSVRRGCELIGLSRAGLYRKPRAPSEQRQELRSAMQREALADPAAGSRRITFALRRRGWRVNRKRIRRMMREDNLLKLRRRRAPRTTDSNHALGRWPNRAKGFAPKGPNQLWAADITYVRLRRELVYLAVVLDVFSRRVVGWALGPTLEAKLPLAALEAALQQRRPPAGLLHHSDQGSQYASREYVERLESWGAEISMSRKGRPEDNAFAESFMKTLKAEEVYLSEYEDLEDAQRQVGAFIERVYNRKRLHSSLGYRPPAEFEEEFRKQAADAA